MHAAEMKLCRMSHSDRKETVAMRFGTTKPVQGRAGLWLLSLLFIIVGVGILIFRWMIPTPSEISDTEVQSQTESQQDLRLVSPSGSSFFDSPIVSATATPPPIVVYVSGAVYAPDVYVVPAESRIKDAVEAAGGFTVQANREQINLAERIEDGQHIQVPRLPETSLQTQHKSDVVEEATMEQSQRSIPININVANVTELQEINGIGPTIAQRIVEYRLQNGPFSAIDELQQVRGISSGLVEDIRYSITLSE